MSDKNKKRPETAEEREARFRAIEEALMGPIASIEPITPKRVHEDPWAKNEKEK